MTSSLAKNSKQELYTLNGGAPNTLVVDSQQRPIEGQVPRTDEVLNIVGGQTYTDVILGANNCTIIADLALGNSTITWTEAGIQGFCGMYGRSISLTLKPSNAGGARTVRIQLPVGSTARYSYQGAANPLVTNRLSFPLTVVSEIELVFKDPGQGAPKEVSVKGDVTGYTFDLV